MHSVSKIFLTLLEVWILQLSNIKIKFSYFLLFFLLSKILKINSRKFSYFALLLINLYATNDVKFIAPIKVQLLPFVYLKDYNLFFF